MGKYLGYWEVDQTKIPIDPKEKGAGWGMLMAMVRKDLEKGVMTSWGAFVGETNGYCLFEGTTGSNQRHHPVCPLCHLRTACHRYGRTDQCDD